MITLRKWCYVCALGLAAGVAQADYIADGTPLPGGTIAEIWAYGPHGSAVGWSNDGAQVAQAVYWTDPASPPMSLTPDSDRYHGWVATGINEYSQIVGNGSNCAPSGVFCDEEPLPWGLFPPAEGYGAFIWFTPFSQPVHLYNPDPCGTDNFVLGISGWVDPKDVPLSNCSPYVVGRSIPEPATLALLGVALAGLGLSRRYKLN